MPAKGNGVTFLDHHHPVFHQFFLPLSCRLLLYYSLYITTIMYKKHLSTECLKNYAGNMFLQGVSIKFKKRILRLRSMSTSKRIHWINIVSYESQRAWIYAWFLSHSTHFLVHSCDTSSTNWFLHGRFYGPYQPLAPSSPPQASRDYEFPIRTQMTKHISQFEFGRSKHLRVTWKENLWKTSTCGKSSDPWPKWNQKVPWNLQYLQVNCSNNYGGWERTSKYFF